MRGAGLVLALSALCVACVAPRRAGAVAVGAEERTPHAASQSLVRVVAETEASPFSPPTLSAGTGFVVDSGVYTATHILLGSDSVYILLPSGRRLGATGWRQIRGDLSLILLAEPTNLPALRVARSLPEGVFDAVLVALWYDGGLGVEVVVIQGRARRTAAPSEMGAPDAEVTIPPGSLIGVSMPLRRGMSGSPLLHDGIVIGICSAAANHWPRGICARCDAGDH